MSLIAIVQLIAIFANMRKNCQKLFQFRVSPITPILPKKKEKKKIKKEGKREKKEKKREKR